MEQISEEKFMDYVQIQKSGETNMFDIPAVMELSEEGLTKEDIKIIMANYDELADKYLIDEADFGSDDETNNPSNPSFGI